MLKIKNNVDLKELEKFGFKENYNNTSLIKEFGDDSSTNDYIAVNKDTRELIIGHYQDEYGATYIKGVSELLFHLVLANLVEKV